MRAQGWRDGGGGRWGHRGGGVSPLQWEWLSRWGSWDSIDEFGGKVARSDYIFSGSSCCAEHLLGHRGDRAEAGAPGQGPSPLCDQPLSPSLQEPVELVRVLKSCRTLVERESWFGCLYSQSVQRTTFMSPGGREPWAVFLCFSWQCSRVVFEAFFSKGLRPVQASPSLGRWDEIVDLRVCRPDSTVNSALSVFLSQVVSSSRNVK